MKNLKNNNQGLIGHIEIFAVIIFISVAGFTAWRITSSNDSGAQASVDTESTQTQLGQLSGSQSELKLISEIRTIAAEQASEEDILNIELEDSSDESIYVVHLRDGSMLHFNATTGEHIQEHSNESTSSSHDSDDEHSETTEHEEADEHHDSDEHESTEHHDTSEHADEEHETEPGHDN